METDPWTPPDTIDFNIETPRLVVRAYVLEDAPALSAAITESRDGHLLPWMSWANEEPSLNAQTAYIENAIALIDDPKRFGVESTGTGIFDKNSGELLGASGMHALDPQTRSASTGYWVRRSATGQGFSEEATRHVFSWAFSPQDQGGMGLDHMFIECAEENSASRRTIEKLQITFDGTLRHADYLPGFGVSTTLRWSVLAKEWDRSTHSIG